MRGKPERIPARLAAILLMALGLSGCLGRMTGDSAPPPGGGWRAIPVSESRAVAQEPRRVEFLDRMVADAVAQSVAETGAGAVAPGEVWAAVIDCRDPRDPRMGSLRGGEPVYPASVVKLCYMVAAYDQCRRGLLPLDESLRRDLDRMIVVSDNKATNRILDRLTHTGFGPELSGAAWDSFAHKRLTVARYMESLGLPGLWATNKTFDETIPLYGRDTQWLGAARGDHFAQSNSMTVDDTARLLYLLWRRAVVDPAACEEMLALMRREGESKTFFSAIRPEGATLYSKSGWTGLEYHDAGIFDFGEEGAIVVVIFSLHRGEGQGSRQPRVIERAAELLLERLRAQPGALDQATADFPADQ